jgi:hypothetical protein
VGRKRKGPAPKTGPRDVLTFRPGASGFSGPKGSINARKARSTAKTRQWWKYSQAVDNQPFNGKDICPKRLRINQQHISKTKGPAPLLRLAPAQAEYARCLFTSTTAVRAAGSIWRGRGCSMTRRFRPIPPSLRATQRFRAMRAGGPAFRP